MRIKTLILCMLGAGGLAVAYDHINRATHLDLRLLLYIAIGLLAFGLYSILRTNDKTNSKEES